MRVMRLLSVLVALGPDRRQTATAGPVVAARRPMSLGWTERYCPYDHHAKSPYINAETRVGRWPHSTGRLRIRFRAPLPTVAAVHA